MIYPSSRSLINTTTVIRKTPSNSRKEIFTDWVRNTKLNNDTSIIEKNRKYISPKQLTVQPGWIDLYIRKKGKDTHTIKYNPNSMTSKRNEHIEYSDLAVAYIYDVPDLGSENDITVIDTLYDLTDNHLITMDNISENGINDYYQQLILERNKLLDIVYGDSYNPNNGESIIVIDYDKYEAIIQSLVTLIRGKVISNTEFNNLVFTFANIYFNSNNYMNMFTLKELVPAIKKDVSLKLIRK